MDKDFSDKNLSISTDIDLLSIEEKSIEAFLAHKEVPDPLKRYVISSSKYTLNHDEIEEYISLDIYSEYSSRLSVSGLDQQWVLSKFQQINDFINGKVGQFEQEQKSIEKDKVVVVEDKNSKILKKYEKRGELKYLPIRKKDLSDLVELIVDKDFSDKNLSISTEIDTISIKGSSLEAFLAHKDVPDPLNRYEITSIKYDAHKNIEKTIYLSIYSKNSSNLSVSGFDEVWVLGKFQQINEFINRKSEQYEEEQKRMEKEIINPETILQKLGRRSLLEKAAGIAVIIGAALQLISMLLHK
ncbi:MAG: hypothetical protein ABR985_02590 [Methanotrichaceae archaeon]